MTLTMTTRPPRPSIPAAHLLELAKEHGIASYRIKAITVLPDTDVLVEEDAGNRYRICTTPDGAGRTGLLVDHSKTGYPVGNIRNFAPRIDSGPNEEWELADFDWEADKLLVPGGVQTVDGFGGMRQWLLTGDDATRPEPVRQPWHVPVAAYALWRNQAASRMRGVTMAEAVQRSDMCAALRQEVINSGWLSKQALAELDAR
jgi:hypothetical protein